MFVESIFILYIASGSEAHTDAGYMDQLVLH